jgi:dUTP pyrophosphatase
MKCKIKKLNPDAQLPTKAHSSDAGHDLYSCETVTLAPMERKVVKTGIAIALPKDLYGRVAPRSGLAVKKGLDVLAGVIDSSYRGEVGVVLINFSNEELVLGKGSKIAQLILETYHDAHWEEVAGLAPSDRENGGFGSSGE